jgi:hypothetical protein
MAWTADPNGKRRTKNHQIFSQAKRARECDLTPSGDTLIAAT